MDETTAVILGICIGIPLGLTLGILLYKILFKEPVYGAQYAYTPDGKLAQYVPIPIPSQTK